MKLPSIKGIPIEYIQSILKLDPNSPSGLIWLPKKVLLSYDVRAWNTKHANKKAGTKHISIKKYLSWTLGFRYLGKYMSFKCSSIVFLLHNGYLTKNMCVQHIDHNPFNNNPSNLRECTKSQNTQYSKLKKTNTSGCQSVFLTTDKLKWYVQIKLNGKSYYFGTHKNKDDAIKASIEARKKLHGEFARIE
jgi:hypothetical protein